MCEFTPDSVRGTCQLLVEHAGGELVLVSEDGLAGFLRTELSDSALSETTIADTNAFPELKLASLADEVGWVALVHALDFGSGFRQALHSRRQGQGAWVTVRAGCVALGQMSTETTAAFLAAHSVADVAKLWDIDGALELEPFAVQLHTVLQEIATGVTAAGCKSLSEFLQRRVLASPDGPTATGITHHLVSAFPITFRDEYHARRNGTITTDPQSASHTVRLYKKAQLVASEIHTPLCRVGYSSGSGGERRLGLPDIASLTAMVDNVVVATLRKGGVLICSPELTKALDSLQPMRRGSTEEVTLRAAAVVATEALVKAWNKAHPDAGRPLLPCTLANYLWGKLGKRSDYRAYPRHHTPDTLFY